MSEKTEILRERIRQLSKDPVCLAFSGGVDSGLLMKLFVEAGARLEAVLFDTRLHPRADLESAGRLAEECGLKLNRWKIDESKDPFVFQNTPERCYYCKKRMFSELKSWAVRRGIFQVAEGTNADDLTAYRPGIRALRELGVISPLAECGMTKAEIRQLAAELGLSAAKKPSAPCLATRLPYGTPLEPELLGRLEAGEEWLRSRGLRQVRLRYHDPVIRMEVGAEEMGLLFEIREDAVAELKRLGFLYITMDLEGFRSGSMDLGREEK